MQHLTKGFGCDFPNTVDRDFQSCPDTLALKIMKPSRVAFFIKGGLSKSPNSP